MPEVGREWHARSTSAFPIQAVLATVSAVVLSCFTVLVLSLSDGVSLGSWFISPSVWLAVLSTSTNALLRFAFSEGAVISWWNLALRGARVKDLHKSWLFSDSFFAALTSASSITLLRVASIIVTLLVIDGPLLQRSSTVGQSERTTYKNITLPIRAYPLWNFTLRGQSLLQPEFNDLMGQYNRREDKTIPSGICVGKCSTTVTIGGFDRNCTSTRQDITKVDSNGQFIKAMNSAGFANGQNAFNRTYLPVFQLDTTVYFGWLQLFSILRDKRDAVDVLVRTCTLKSALVNLDLDITNTTVSVRPSSWTENRTVELTDLDEEYRIRAVGGFELILQQQYGSAVGKDPFNGSFGGGSEAFDGASAYTYLNQTNIDEHFAEANLGLNTYNNTWVDPFPDYFRSVDEISLRYAIKQIPQTPNRLQEYTTGMSQPDGPILPRLASVIEQNQTVIASQTTQDIVYRIDKPYLILALAVMLMATSSIGSTLFGWWHLGRRFTFSPLEIAKAFDAQLLEAAGSNMRVKEILHIGGEREIRYGALAKGLETSHSTGTAGFGLSDRLSSTSAPSEDDNGTTRSKDYTRLLMLDALDNIGAEKPRKGQIYY